MKTYKQFIEEDFRTEVVPAIQGYDGTIHKGRRGEDHAELRLRKMKEPGKPLEGIPGYYHRKSGFLTKKEMGGMDSTRLLTPKEREARERRQGFDTTDTMTKVQRMRKYGTFEE